MNIVAEYIWYDGNSLSGFVSDIAPIALRSMTKVFSIPDGDRKLNIDIFPRWEFDGSQTGQGAGQSSDCILVPVNFTLDPTREKNHERIHCLVLCEVFYPDKRPHLTNTRSDLRETLAQFQHREPLISIEQEYMLMRDNERHSSYPRQRNSYYCAVGINEVVGRDLVEDHLAKCLDSRLIVGGVKASRWPGQWTLHVGTADPLVVCDHLTFAKWLLHRVGEDRKFGVSFDHSVDDMRAIISFSTVEMRDPAGGLTAIESAVERLENTHESHTTKVQAYRNHRSQKKFRWAVGDFNASVRIPLHVAQSGCGHIEDRRPHADADPYVLARLMIETVCGEG
jgi:glutamine synthetase